MIGLVKPLSRLTTHWRQRGRPVVVTLEPGDSISFRLKGTRTIFRTSLEGCFWLAARALARAGPPGGDGQGRKKDEALTPPTQRSALA
jgi:hypothetical protein